VRTAISVLRLAFARLQAARRRLSHELLQGNDLSDALLESERAIEALRDARLLLEERAQQIEHRHRVLQAAVAEPDQAELEAVLLAEGALTTEAVLAAGVGWRAPETSAPFAEELDRERMALGRRRRAAAEQLAQSRRRQLSSLSTSRELCLLSRHRIYASLQLLEATRPALP